MPNKTQHPIGQAGFTLVEMLVVIAIIGILAGLVFVNLGGKAGEARIAATSFQIKQIETALKIYRTEQGRYPTQAQGLSALVQKPTLEPVPARYPEEPYLEGGVVPQDPWGNPYSYLIPGRQNEPYEIISYGSDGEPGGDGEGADISSSPKAGQ